MDAIESDEYIQNTFKIVLNDEQNKLVIAEGN